MIRHKIFHQKNKETKERKIRFLLKELEDCKNQIKSINNLMKSNSTDIEQKLLVRNYEALLSKKSSISSKLESLGFQVERRGRPKKSDSEKYSSTRTKFTAMLLPENLEYLKALKKEKKIKNISDFLDKLIEDYRNNS